MDVRAKQLLSYQRCPLNFSGLGSGFAPRHLSRWARCGEIMKYFIIALLILFLFNEIAFGQAQAREKSLTIQQQLTELNKNFTYKSKPVHPRAIQDLVSWVADPLPGPIAVDVEGTFETNRYFGDYETRENGLIYIDLKQKILEQEGWFAYQYLGRLANGFHVLRTFDNGGGTGVVQSLLLVECLIDFEYKDDGSRRALLVIKRRGEFGIGDRYSGEIKLELKENAISVGADKRNVEKPYQIKLQ
jgi:hypothetical protein